MIRRRFKYFMPERNEFSTTGEETLLSVSEYYGVKPRSDAFEADAAESRADSLKGYRKVSAGDFVMNYMLAWKGAYGVSDHDGIVSPAYAVYRIDSRYADRRFIHHRLRSEHMRSKFRARSKGVIESRLRLYPVAFLSMEIELPELETQRAIAHFLDRETARIDQLIKKKQRLVEVFNDSRDSAISRAVTVGLDEHADLIETNSPYLPMVPNGWRVWRLKHLARVRGGLTLGRSVHPDEPLVSVPYLRVANVQAGWLDLSDIAEIDAKRTEIEKFALAEGDVLMNEGGDNDKLGRGAVWTAPFGPCLNQNHVFAVRPSERRQSEWISLATNARYARDYFFLHSNQSTNLASISKTNLEKFPVAVPPSHAMQDILDRLQVILDRSRNLTSRVQASIDRLREFRSALITAAVTGQIDVTTKGKSGETDWRLDMIEKEMDSACAVEQVEEHA